MAKKDWITEKLGLWYPIRCNIMTQKIKSDWIEPVIEDLGDATDLIEGGIEGGDPKILGSGDQFAVNDLTT